MLNYLKFIYYLLRPKTRFIRRTSDAMGDSLLLSASLQGLRQKYPKHKIIIESKWKELFINNPNVDWVTKHHISTTKRHLLPKYKIVNATTTSIYKQISRYVSKDRIFYPEIFLTKDEIQNTQKKYSFPYISVCPQGKSTFSANRKEWGSKKFQRLRNYFPTLKFVQIGSKTDKLLINTLDARGLNIRESAAIIKNSLFFIGLEGGLMHLAKAVEKKSVIIYGGFIRPEISQYKENLNIVNLVDCSPCFSSEEPHSDCLDKKCMDEISAEFVFEEIKKSFMLELKAFK